MENIDVLLKEYDTLRAESLAAIANRSSILSYGLATVGILYTGVAALNLSNSTSNSILPSVILMIVSPTLCAFITMNWLGEFERMHRAGSYLVILEEKINKLIGENLLNWETSLKSTKKHMKYPYHSTTLFLTFISFLSYFIGLFIYKMHFIYYIFFSFIGIILITIFHIIITLKMKKIIK